MISPGTSMYDFLRAKSEMHARIWASPKHAPCFARTWSNTIIVFSIKNNNLYFYYDIMMKIPGIGGGGECGWLEDVPENGLCPLTVSERDLKSSFALWVMKVI